MRRPESADTAETTRIRLREPIPRHVKPCGACGACTQAAGVHQAGTTSVRTAMARRANAKRSPACPRGATSPEGGGRAPFGQPPDHPTRRCHRTDAFPPGSPSTFPACPRAIGIAEMKSTQLHFLSIKIEKNTSNCDSQFNQCPMPPSSIPHMKFYMRC